MAKILFVENPDDRLGFAKKGAASVLEDKGHQITFVTAKSQAEAEKVVGLMKGSDQFDMAILNNINELNTRTSLDATRADAVLFVKAMADTGKPVLIFDHKPPETLRNRLPKQGVDILDSMADDWIDKLPQAVELALRPTRLSRLLPR